MNKGRYEHKDRHCIIFGSKSLTLTLTLALACILLVGGVIGGTVAWLTDQTPEVKNTFSTSNIGVKLKETTTEYKMIPGWDIAKDPKAWVTEGSEAAYLFVKVEKSANFDTFMTCEIAEGWTELTSAAGDNYKVYYREIAANQMGETNASAILKENRVTVKDTVTKDMMTAIDFTQPTLTFTAYAHQLYSAQNTMFDPTTVWDNLNK